MLPIAQATKRRRVTGKSMTPAAYAAIRAEKFNEAELPVLPLGARRQHVHYTQNWTHNKRDVQPDQMTRRQFWEHLLRVYREVYPDADSDTGSILQFGLVVKERHRDAPRMEESSEHHHAATFSSTAHYWRRIRQVSAEKYRVHLNAVAHDGHTSMYRYLRCPTQKKPLAELDPDAEHSAGHPKGDALKAARDGREDAPCARVPCPRRRNGDRSDSSSVKVLA